MTIAPLNDLTREKYEINERVKTGIVITQIKPGSIAERAGLGPGDVILEINRHDVNPAEDFEKLYKKSKEKLLLLVYRKGRSYYLVLR